MLVKLSLAAAGLVLLLALVLAVPMFSRERSLFLGAYLLVIGNALFPIWLFQGLERMRIIAALSAVGRVAAIAAIFLAVNRRAEYALAATLQSSALAVAGILALPYVYMKLGVRLAWPGLRTALATMADGWHVFISSAAVNLYTGGSVFLLGLVASPVIVGYFAAAQKIAQAAQQIIAPISQATFPHVAALSAEFPDRALRFLAKLLRRQGALTAAVSLAVIAMAPWIVRLILGEGYEPSIELVRLLGALPFIVGLSNVFGIQVMLNFGIKREFSRILVAAGVLNVVLVVALGALLGAEGAAISVLVTELCITCAMAAVVWRRGLLRPIVAPRP